MKNAKNIILAELDAGLPINEALDNMPEDTIRDLAMELIRRGADPMRIVNLMDSKNLTANLEELLELGVSADLMAKRVDLEKRQVLELLRDFGVSGKVLCRELEKDSSETLLKNLKWLMLNHLGDSIRLESLIENASKGELERNLEQLLWAGVEPVVLARKIESMRASRYLNLFYDAGATGNELVKVLDPCEILVNFRWLVAHGAEIDLPLVIKRTPGSLRSAIEVEVLLFFGASPYQLAGILSEEALLENLAVFQRHGLSLMILAERFLMPDTIIENIPKFSNLGLNPRYLKLHRMERQAQPATLAINFSLLVDAGAEPKDLIELIPQPVMDTFLKEIAEYPELDGEEKELILSKFSASAIIRNLEFLEERDFPIQINDIYAALTFSERETHLEELYARGVKIDFGKLVKQFDEYQISKHLPLLLQVGVDPNFLVNRTLAKTINRELERFLKYGANPNIIALRLENEDLITRKEILLAHGADMWLQ